MDVTTLRDGTRVRVTRILKDGHSAVWEGTISRIAPNGGFRLDGIDAGTRREEHGYFSGSATVLELYGCVQTVEVIGR